MVLINSLRNLEGEHRNVREVCTSGNISVVVYEPSRADIEKILEMQDEIYETDTDGNVQIKVDGVTMIRKIYPLVTDLEGIEDLSNEELENILENPSIALIQASSVIEQIIIEVYKIQILAIRKQLVEQDLDYEQFRFQHYAAQKIMERVEREGGLEEIEQKVKKANKELEELSESKHELEVAQIFDETQRFEKMTKENSPVEKQDQNKNRAPKSLIPMNIEPGTEDENLQSVMDRYNKEFGLNLNVDE